MHGLIEQQSQTIEEHFFLRSCCQELGEDTFEGVWFAAHFQYYRAIVIPYDGKKMPVEIQFS